MTVFSSTWTWDLELCSSPKPLDPTTPPHQPKIDKKILKKCAEMAQIAKSPKYIFVIWEKNRKVLVLSVRAKLVVDLFAKNMKGGLINLKCCVLAN